MKALDDVVNTPIHQTASHMRIVHRHYIWGFNRQNMHGVKQNNLLHKGLSLEETTELKDLLTEPTSFMNNSAEDPRLQKISLGYQHGVAIGYNVKDPDHMKGGILYSWGQNKYGQLGRGRRHKNTKKYN